MARTGMIDVIKKVRSLAAAGREDFAIDGENYFSDDHLQSILDSNVTQIEDLQITWLQETIDGSTATWIRAVIPYRDTEGTASGTAYWVLRDASGSAVTSGYSVNHDDGLIRFTATQGGTAYYLTARSYDAYSAAADVWGRKAAYYSDWYSFSSDGQSFQRQQAYEQAIRMEERMRQRSGQNKLRGGMQMGMFQRTDLNRW